MIHDLIRLLTGRGFWNFLGLVALAFLVWIAGPLLAIGAWRPLESERARMLLIAAMFALWLLRLLWRKWREGRLNAQLLGQLRKPAQKKKAEPAGADPEMRELAERFDEAMQRLRTMRFGPGKQRPWSRLSRQHLYQLPWYVFIGAPGSGKTTALVNSGLNFPLADRYGKVALRGVGGTHNCDWWFTDEAVLLDTAGRYTTHESNPVGDEKEWRGFLGLLTRFRGRQPINGAILTISLADLLSASDSERVQHAAVLRQRLQELRQQLGIQFPIYVLVTKVDLLSGFEEYFASFSREDLAQVWGFTLPYAKSLEPDFDLYAAYHAEYRLLQRRLDDALPDVLAAEPDPARRALAYMLPQQFAGLQNVLGHFLSDVFGASRFEARLMPRGVYFTSGTQGGETFDQVTGRLKRYLRIEGSPQPASLPGEQPGRSYFLKNLLQQVVFREAGLAGRNLRWERRYRAVHWAGYTLVTLALGGLLAGWLLSYRNNANYVADVQARVPQVQARAQEVRISGSGDVLGLMPYLDSLSGLPATPGFDIARPPLGYRFGLYQGGKMSAAAQGVYRRTLDEVLLPLVARRIEAALEGASPDDLEFSYEALRAYQMLYETDHYDPEFMHAWLLADMQQVLPPDYTRQQYDNLSAHLRALARDRVVVSPFPRNDALVERTRQRLASYPLAERAYSRLRRMLADNENLEPTTVTTLAGPQAASVFIRASGLPLTQGIPGLYSYEGYWDIFAKRIDEVAQSLRRDDAWVLGLPAPGVLDAQARSQLSAEIRRLYLNDYVTEWDNYLDDLRIAPGQSLLHNIQVARTLSAPDSPLVRLVQGVARQTTLLRDSRSQDYSLADQARESVSSTRRTLEQMFGSVAPVNAPRPEAGEDRPERIVDRHFEPYRRLVSSEGGGPPPIAATTGLINELYTYLTAADAALRSANTPPNAEVVTKLRAEAGRMPAPVGGLLENLSVAATDQVSTLMRARLGENVGATIGLFCRQAIAGRYPFSPTASREVAPSDMARLFAPNGMMDDFLQKHLVSQIDVSAGSWRFKPGIDGGLPAGGSGYLDAFQRATVIRDVYFSGGDTLPSYQVTIRPVEMDAQITQFVLDVDGQVVRYAHGPQVGTTVRWPGPRGTNQVRLAVTPVQGESGLATSGPWALNRMLDRARLRPGASPEITEATFEVGGRKVVLEIVASSIKSPFSLPEMRGFSCPGQP
ncbi:type VI secretion system membrane subunit TssM [Orrella sp. JC864]|uniref:type VI secretion system membrane subunit TssM n=1 Tax=Orrella sp. JC864 TaxID=3120298 RepID=UPI00300A51F6